VDYAGYRRWRDQVVVRRPEVRRLDCMNPARALASWVPAVRGAARERDPAAAFARATGHLVSADQVVIGRGVRELLEAAFTVVAGRPAELWLPEDVYPAYWELARAAGLTAHPFALLGAAAWSFLEWGAAEAVAVLPVPLSPLGRWPTRGEQAALLAWLRGSAGRTLLVDAVYTYDFPASEAVLAPLLVTGRCAVLWSCSKSWLRRDALGIAQVPPAWAAPMQAHTPAPDPTAAIALMEEQPDLPSRQEQAFAREWARLATPIRAAAPDWQPPTTGYFSTVAMSPYRLLTDHAILSVPASVFGSRSDDLSVISCLHDLASNEREGVARREP
jgi:histidinol-phosphate/aromatic aminotransferase/cobyric acid decarboxylase-like protein